MRKNIPHWSSALTLACCMAWGASAAHAAADFAVSNGIWIIPAEDNGQPGRGMAVDVVDDTLVMQVYNYTASGEPTFHFAAGPMNGNRFTGDLTTYRGGRYFGSGPRTGVLNGNAGQVTIDFTSATTGTIALPGESPVSFSRFVFDGTPKGYPIPGMFIVAEMDGDTPVNAWTMQAVYRTNDSGLLEPYLYGETASEVTIHDRIFCIPIAVSNHMQCSISMKSRDTGNNIGTYSFTVQTTVDRLEGTIKRPNARENRLVGYRIMNQHLWAYEIPVSAVETGLHWHAPESGTWIVRSENTGDPGRGMAIDLQGTTLLLQVYNYDANGNATFHLAVAPYLNATGSGNSISFTTQAELKHYRGGRYFGGPAQTGVETGSAGEVSVFFDTPTSGTIQFPGEAPVAIERLPIGVQAPNPEALLGQWVFRPNGEPFKTVHLTTIADGQASDGQNFRCRYEDTPQGSVRCIESYRISGRAEVITRDYRFTPSNGRGVGRSMSLEQGQPNEAEEGQYVYTLRIKDRHGVPISTKAP